MPPQEVFVHQPLGITQAVQTNLRGLEGTLAETSSQFVLLDSNQELKLLWASNKETFRRKQERKYGSEALRFSSNF